MKIVCINNMELGRDSYGKPRHKRLPITIGSVYDTPDGIITSGNDRFYMLEKDNEKEMITYPSHYFVTLDIWREQQLNKLGL